MMRYEISKTQLKKVKSSEEAVEVVKEMEKIIRSNKCCIFRSSIIIEA